MKALGIDAGSIERPVAVSAWDEAAGGERTSSDPSAGGHLVSAGIILDAGAPLLEWSAPLAPHGVGGEWPPEAIVGGNVGARRVPLALVIAQLEVPFASTADTSSRTDADAGSLQWRWPRLGGDAGLRGETSPATTLIQRALLQRALCESGSLTLAIPNALPLLSQSSLLGTDRGRVHLIWRCMAAALGYSAHCETTPSSSRPVPKPGVDALHIHLGIDGFEASLFSYQLRRGRAGPQLVVPARRRASYATTTSDPFMGLKLLIWALRTRGIGSPVRIWESIFGSSIAGSLSADAEDRSAPAPATAPKSGNEWEVWARFRQMASITQDSMDSSARGWIDSVESLVKRASKYPAFAICTGEFFNKRWCDSALLPTAASLQAGLLSRLERLRVPVLVEPDVIATGAALFGSRRQREWATYLDELPTVEILVEQAGKPRWTKILGSDFVDAGTPERRSYEGFRHAAGERLLELPVYVDEFGLDTKEDVLRCRIEFEKPSVADVGAVVWVEVQAASGLPVVTAQLQSDEKMLAQVDWSRDRDSMQTRMSKLEYIDSLPKIRRYPPLEQRAAAAWWVKPEKFKVCRVANLELTGDQLCGHLASFKQPSDAKLLELVENLYRLASKRAFDASSGTWHAATGGDGRNNAALHLDSAVTTLLGIATDVRRDSRCKLQAKTRRVLALLFVQDPRWRSFLMKQLGRVASVTERDPLLTAWGNCIVQRDELSRVIAGFSARLHDRVEAARSSWKQPTGIDLLKSLGTLFALREDSAVVVSDEIANQLARDVSEFMRLLVQRQGSLKTKFQEAIRAFAFLLRRRAHQPNFVEPGSQAFSTAIECVTVAYVYAQIFSRRGIVGAARRRDELNRFRAQLLLPDLGNAGAKVARLPQTVEVINRVDLTQYSLNESQFPKNSERLITLIGQVMKYVEGKGSGILIAPDDEGDDGSDSDGDD